MFIVAVRRIWIIFFYSLLAARNPRRLLLTYGIFRFVTKMWYIIDRSGFWATMENSKERFAEARSSRFIPSFSAPQLLPVMVTYCFISTSSDYIRDIRVLCSFWQSWFSSGFFILARAPVRFSAVARWSHHCSIECHHSKVPKNKETVGHFFISRSFWTATELFADADPCCLAVLTLRGHGLTTV